MRPPKLNVPLTAGFLAKLREQARLAGFEPDEYAASILSEHIRRGTTTTEDGRPRGPRGPGRPLLVDDVPATVERDASATGFVGVTAKGRAWQAKAGKTVLGRFSSPELAATVRYYALHGFRIGRGAFIASLGVDVATAMSDAARVPFEPLSAAAEKAGQEALDQLRASGASGQDLRRSHTPDTAGGESSELSEVATPRRGPGSAEGSRATPADGGRAPSTSMESVAQSGGFGQVCALKNVAQYAMLGPRDRDTCAACAAALDATPRVRENLCVACNADFTTWLALQEDNEEGTPTVFTSNPKGAPRAESFIEYAKRVRS